MKRRSFLKKTAVTAAASAGAVASAFPAPAIASDTVRWSMTTTWPKNFPGLGTGANKLAEFVQKASGGRMEIKVYGAGELVPAFDAIDAVSNGTVEMGHGAPYYWKGKVPAVQFLGSMPFGLTVQEQNAWLDFGGGQELADDIYRQMGCKFFAAGNTGVQMGGWYNRPINTIEDYKGLKLRMPGLGGEVAKLAGATVVNLPGGELLASMQSGAIDAMEWVGPYNDLAFGIHKVAKHYYYPGWHEPNATLDAFINLNAWQKLPDDLKVIVETACRAANQYVLNEFTARNGTALQSLTDKHGIAPKPFPGEVMTKLQGLSKQVIGDLVASDPVSKKVHASMETFAASTKPWTAISEQAYMNAR